MPPSIPTSFVPHASQAGPRRFRTDFTGAFAFLSYGVFLIVIIASVGIFFYEQILDNTLKAKNADLAQKEAAIDPATVESFVRLRDRLVFGKSLLENHIAVSNFFSFFGTNIPTSVRFASLHLSQDSQGTFQLSGTGEARSFNALAAASSAFADGGRIKDAIFSHITVSKTNTVSFAFAASLDPKLVSFMATGAPASTTQP